MALAGDGGSIYANGQITLSGSSLSSKTFISHSTALTNGGGLYAAKGLFLLGELQFANNTAQNGEGGADCHLRKDVGRSNITADLG